MKARLLKKLLNNTGYTVANYDEYIAVGSALCHDLIKIDVETKKVSYALDTWREGRKALKHAELIFIWDRLHEMIESGEFDHIIKGDDKLEEPLPVFTIRDGMLFETTTDAYGWPNVTKEGYMMYDNTYFKTKPEAVEYGIRDCQLWLDTLQARRSDLSNDMQKITDKISIVVGHLEELKKQ